MRQEGFHKPKAMANVVIVEGLSSACEHVQIQALEV